MKFKKLLALLLSAALVLSVTAFTPALPAAVAAKDTLRLLPTDDSFVSFQSGSENEVYGGKTTLEIGYHPDNPLPADPGYTGIEGNELKYSRDIMLKFDLDGVDVNSISSAVLKLTSACALKNSDKVTGVSLIAFDCGDGWSEDTLTRSNAPEVKNTAGVSSLISNNTAVGSVIEIDLTNYIRTNPKETYSFRVMCPAAGLDFYSKEYGVSSARPALEIETDGQLSSSRWGRTYLMEDSFTFDKDGERDNPHGSEDSLCVASVSGNNPAGAERNSYIKFKLPDESAAVHYDRVTLVLRGKSVDNADNTVSLAPVSNDWSEGDLVLSNAPKASGEAAASFTVVDDDVNMPLSFFKIDLTDYVNANQSQDGIYSFVLSCDTAIEYFYSSNCANEFSCPYVEYISRENSRLTLHYTDAQKNDIAAAKTFTLPQGQLFTPEDYPMSIDGGYYFSSEKTAAVNPFPFTVPSGESDIYLIYENKAITGFEEINATTAQYEKPLLPEKITVMFNDGSSEVYPVAWSEISEESYSSGGEFTVMGTLIGIESDPVSARVTVLGITGVRVPTVSTAPGSAPSLPSSLVVDLSDGSSHSMDVLWDEIASESYASVGSFIVYGSLTLSGMPVQLTVLVEEGDINDRTVIADAYTQFDEPNTPHNTEELRISLAEGAGAANTNRKAFLRFNGGDFGESYYDPERQAEIDSIVSSKIRLYVTSIANNATVTYSVYGIAPENDSWDETSLTWNGSESDMLGAEYISSLSVKQSSFSASWIELDVTDFVRNHRDDENLSFYIEANTCATIAASKESGEESAPVLRTTNYIPDAPVTVRSVAEIGGKTVDIAEPISLKGKLNHPYEYQSAIPNPIYYPEADPEGIYYYDFLTSPNPPADDEKDPDLHLDSLNEDGNEILIKYVRREIISADAVEAETYRGVKPSLPSTVAAYLDNGTPVTENVVWRWDETDFRSYGTKGEFTLYGDIEHSDSVSAEAVITVHEAYYGDAFGQLYNEFDVEPETDYRLTFTLAENENIPEYIGGIVIKTGNKYEDVLDMDSREFTEYLSTFNKGDTVEVFLTTPASEKSMTLVLPDCLTYILEPRLAPVLGRGGDMTLHYMYEGEEIYTAPVNIPFGDTFTLSEDDFTILDGAYTVTGLDAENSDITKLTDSIVMDKDGLNAYLLCSYSPVFTMSASVENAMDANLSAYAHCVADIFNGTSADKKVTVIAAKYDDEGKLQSVESEEITVPANSERAVTSVKNVSIDTGYAGVMLWNDITGLTPYIPKVDSRNPNGENKKPDTGDCILIPTLERYITASAQQSGNEAVNILTRDLSTRWSAQADYNNRDPQWAVIDLGGVYDLHTIGLAFYNGKSRYSLFAVDISDDGEMWNEIISPRYSSGRTNSVEYFSFSPETAAYVRIRGYGWKANKITDEGLVEDSGDWFSVTAFEAYGPMNDLSGVTVGEYTDFEGLNGEVVGDSADGSESGWGSAALNEMTYTDYTPSKGTDLFADFALSPAAMGMSEGNTALHIYDNVDRDGDETTGAGSIGVFHKLEIPSEHYKIRFKWFVPNTIEDNTYNAQWAGLTLSGGTVKGGADTSHPVAFQLRLSPSGKNKMSFNYMRSITYNEGSQTSLLGSGTAFSSNCLWDVALDVDESSNTVIVTVSDGSRTESSIVRYGLFNNERTITQTWSNSSVNTIMFNSGAGGKCEMYIDDFSVTAVPDSDVTEGTVMFSEDFSGFTAGEKIRDEIDGISSALIKETNQSYTSSYGTMLDVNIERSLMGGNALHLYDLVSRDGDSTKGAGGVFAYIDLPEFSKTNITKLKFDMYAPISGEYGGFALGRGHNEGGDDTTNPLALQARFSPQTDGMQFNMNSSIWYNKGSYSALVGTGSNRLGTDKVWSFEISVNPNLGNMTVKVTDGSLVSSRTVTIPTGDGADWVNKPINTLIINTGAGTSGNIYIDNIEVIDTGVSKNSLAAVNGVIRLENEYAGNGYYVVHANAAGSALGVSSNQNPYYTRIVERRGLADPESVSFELMDKPGYFVVADTSWNVSVQKYSDTDQFRRDATFNKVNNICGAGSTAFSYQLYRNPKLYLRLNGSIITVAEITDNTGSGIRKACTFHLRNEANSYVSDSFNGSTLSSQWYKGYPWYANYHNHSAVHRDSNVVVSGGRVLLKATKRGDNEWIKNSSGQTGYSDSINGGTWKRYVAWTGVISINSKVYNKGSYIEGSFKQPNSPRGYWTAFWLNGRDSWPPETDMFEYLSSKGTSTWYTATHGGTEGAGWQTSSAVGNLRTQYHTFAIDWGYNYMTMYVNGSAYFKAPDTSYQKNMYLILNTGIGAWESEPDSTTVWNTGLECEYIRSYQYY